MVTGLPQLQKKTTPTHRKGGQFEVQEEASPRKQNIRRKNRERATFKRRKDAIVKAFSQLGESTNFTAFFAIRSKSKKTIMYGSTDPDFLASFQSARPLLDQESVKKSTQLVIKTDDKAIFQNINNQEKPSLGVASHSPLPDPSQLPPCLKDLASEQRSTLENIQISIHNNSDGENELPGQPVVKRSKKSAKKKQK